jgi:hypothetical protein
VGEGGVEQAVADDEGGVARADGIVGQQRRGPQPIALVEQDPRGEGARLEVVRIVGHALEQAPRGPRVVPAGAVREREAVQQVGLLRVGRPRGLEGLDGSAGLAGLHQAGGASAGAGGLLAARRAARVRGQGGEREGERDHRARSPSAQQRKPLALGFQVAS